MIRILLLPPNAYLYVPRDKESKSHAKNLKRSLAFPRLAAIPLSAALGLLHPRRGSHPDGDLCVMASLSLREASHGDSTLGFLPNKTV